LKDSEKQEMVLCVNKDVHGVLEDVEMDEKREEDEYIPFDMGILITEDLPQRLYVCFEKDRICIRTALVKGAV
jgi:hypothetical protein